MKRLRIYISGPLSTGNRQENVKKACDCALELIKLGYSPYCPHLTDYLDPDDSLGHATWMECDLLWVEVSDAVLRLPGESKGADMEVAKAHEMGIPVYNSIEELQAKPPSMGDERFHRLLREMAILHNKKSQDYSSKTDLFANCRASEEWHVPGWIGCLIRASDKVVRLKSFVAKGFLANEGVEDSLKDLAAYALIALILYREKQSTAVSNGLR